MTEVWAIANTERTHMVGPFESEEMANKAMQLVLNAAAKYNKPIPCQVIAYYQEKQPVQYPVLSVPEDNDTITKQIVSVFIRQGGYN